MRAVLHYLIVVPFTYFIAILPFFVLRGLAYFMYLVLYRIFGYRKKVVRQNLRNAFPEKTEHEIIRIERKFFLHLADVMLETLKMLTMNDRMAKKHIRIPKQGVDLINSYNDQGKSLIIAIAHYGCWEWGNYGYQAEIDYELRGIYHPLSDPYFEKLMQHMRTRSGSIAVKMKETLRYMIQNRKRVANTAFVADQSPSPHGAHWTIFLNQETGFFYGMEKIARKLDMPVVFLSIDKEKRSHYVMNFEPLIDNPAQTEEGEITEEYVRRLEKRIQEKPEHWLWSHRRWKHKRPEKEQLYQGNPK